MVRPVPTPDRLDLLETFVRIVEAGSLSAAALQLSTTQPTVSRRLQALERVMGVRLLRRSTHRMSLTEDGERCLERARRLLCDWHEFESDLSGAGEDPAGSLRVMVPHAFGQQHLVTPLADYLRRAPRVDVEWLLHDRRPDFLAEGVDCAIQVGGATDPGVVTVRLSEIPRVLVAAPSLVGAGRPPADPGQLVDLPWIAMRPYYRDEVALKRPGDASPRRLPLRPRLETDSLFALRNAALEGVGVALVSKWVVADDIAAGRLVHLLPDWRGESLPVYLAYPHARFYPARLRRFVDTMKTSVPAVVGA